MLTISLFIILGSVLINPIGADFNEAGICLHSFAELHNHQKHSDYLKTLDCGDDVEV